jgi:phytoene dehydrogenase-like protein
MGGVAAKFKSPLLRESWRFAYDDFSVLAFLICLTWMHKKEAGYTIGGSMPLMRSVEKRYAGLGGKLNYKSKVTRILVENDRAIGVRLENGDKHRADHIISAADGHTTIFDMLEGKYIDDTIRSYYTDLPIFTPLIFIGLGVNRSFADLPQVISGITIELDQPVIFGGLEQRKLHVRIHNFDTTLAPPGKSVLTVMIDSDYDYWRKLKADPAQYKSEKERIAHTVINILERRFPGLAGQVEMVDVATPVTFERYTGNWQGGYEGWLVTPKTVNMNMKKTLPGLSNFYMAGQWVMPGGGLPGGAMAGRYVTQMLCKRDGKKLVVTKP